MTFSQATYHPEEVVTFFLPANQMPQARLAGSQVRQSCRPTWPAHHLCLCFSLYARTREIVVLDIQAKCRSFLKHSYFFFENLIVNIAELIVKFCCHFLHRVLNCRKILLEFFRVQWVLSPSCFINFDSPSLLEPQKLLSLIFTQSLCKAQPPSQFLTVYSYSGVNTAIRFTNLYVKG